MLTLSAIKYTRIELFYKIANCVQKDGSVLVDCSQCLWASELIDEFFDDAKQYQKVIDDSGDASATKIVLLA